MAAGCVPVVDIPAFRDLIGERRSGLLVDFPDASATAAAITRCWAGPWLPGQVPARQRAGLFLEAEKYPSGSRSMPTRCTRRRRPQDPL